MILTVLMWAALVYIVCIVAWRLFVAVMMVIGGYQESGLGGAVIYAVFNLLMALWDLAGFAFGVLIIILIVRGCAH